MDCNSGTLKTTILAWRAKSSLLAVAGGDVIAVRDKWPFAAVGTAFVADRSYLRGSTSQQTPNEAEQQVANIADHRLHSRSSAALVDHQASPWRPRCHPSQLWPGCGWKYHDGESFQLKLVQLGAAFSPENILHFTNGDQVIAVQNSTTYFQLISTLTKSLHIGKNSFNYKRHHYTFNTAVIARCPYLRGFWYISGRHGTA